MSFATAADGTRIYYERRGEGPAVIFLHGAGSNAATWWQQVPSFSRQFTCLAIDNRGYGRSPAPAESYHPAVFPADVLAVMDHAGVERAALIGQSLGGMTALRIALTKPQRTWALVASDSPLGIDHPRLLPEVRDYLARAKATQAENRALSRGFAEAQPELAYLYSRLNAFNPMVHSPEATPGLNPHFGLVDEGYLLPHQRLASLACPTLFIVGAEDPLVQAETMREVAALVPGSRFEVIDGAGHSPYFEQPAVFNRHVLGFLQEHAPH